MAATLVYAVNLSNKKQKRHEGGQGTTNSFSYAFLN